MTKQEKRIIGHAIKRLKGEYPVSDEAAEALDALRPYLDSWVIPSLEILIDSDGAINRRNQMQLAEELIER